MKQEVHFDALYNGPETDLSLVVEYPDLIFHAHHLAAAARSHRYRYAITDVRDKHDITVLRGAVYLDGRSCADFLRIEYRASRLLALARGSGRRLGETVLAWLRLDGEAEATVPLHFCTRIQAYHLELWSTLEPPEGETHDHSILDMMGRNAPITRVRSLASKLAAVARVGQVELAFREPDHADPICRPITDPHWDNNYHAAVYDAHGADPDDPANRVPNPNYLIDFSRGFFRPAGSVPPVLFRNWRMEANDPEASSQNILSRRWLVQREGGGGLVHLVEGTLLPGGVEGCHRHVGAEELIYVIAGQGLAYVAAGDLADAENYAAVARSTFGIGERPCRELPLGPGAMLYTKSGGVHGVRNTGSVPLIYVSFLYQTT